MLDEHKIAFTVNSRKLDGFEGIELNTGEPPIQKQENGHLRKQHFGEFVAAKGGITKHSTKLYSKEALNLCI